MVGFLSWFQNNWASLIGAAGIIGSLCFSAMTVQEDCKARQVANLLALDERHRTLWSEAQQRQDLKRIMSDRANLLTAPLTVEEDLFMRRIILHFETGWRLEKIMNRGELKILAVDIGAFFSLPIPQAVWQKAKEFRNPKFVQFVEKALAARR